MTKSAACVALALAVTLSSRSVAQPPPIPTSRANAESRRTNFSRYNGEDAFRNASMWELGVVVEYTTDGAVVLRVLPGSVAQQAGIRKDDIIMEVDGAPVGLIRHRVYRLWPFYNKSTRGKVQLLICFVDDTTDSYRYFAQEVQLAPIREAAPGPPQDTSPLPPRISPTPDAE